jgi:hypothetical protein
MAKKLFSILIVSVILTCVACGRKEEAPVSVERKDGVEYVHNGSKPLNPGRTVSFEEDLTIRPEDEAGNIRIFYPSFYDVDEKGLIYICDYKDPSVKVFDSEGRFVRTIGRKGSGPGEIQNVGRIALAPDGQLLVLDWELRRTSTFRADGSFEGSHQWKNSSFDIFLVRDSFYVRDETLVEPIFASETWKRKLHVKAYDYSGKEVFTFGEFAASQSGFVNEEGRRFSFSLPFEVRSVLAGDSKNGRLYHCLNDKYLIEVFDENGRIFRKIDRPYERLRVTEEDKKRYLSGFQASEKDRALIEKNVEMPTQKPVTERMIVGDSGRLWVALMEERKEDGRTLTAYDVFDEKGFYVSEIWSEVSVGLIRNGKMYRLSVDKDTGDRILKRYRIVWSN